MKLQCFCYFCHFCYTRKSNISLRQYTGQQEKKSTERYFVKSRQAQRELGIFSTLQHTPLHLLLYKMSPETLHSFGFERGLVGYLDQIADWKKKFKYSSRIIFQLSFDAKASHQVKQCPSCFFSEQTLTTALLACDYQPSSLSWPL